MKPSSPQRAPLFVRAFAALFGIIGLTLIGFLWFGFEDDFHAPPLFFKVFASLIATGFVIVGFGSAWTAGRSAAPSAPSTASPHGGGAYDCPNCGAGLSGEEVSPSGDVKCGYCSRWFNIHRRL